MIDGEPWELDEFAGMLPLVESCDWLDTVHAGMTRYEKDKSRKKVVPFDRSTVRWYTDLVDATKGVSGDEEEFLDDFDKGAVDVKEAEEANG